uniref:Homoserine dehydrogenase n=1 Tax=Magnetococcus massalia (strain MO-1) TaxID=451514 RepID=A0A1S7LI45_MAGMO|nr:Homoserine dehydrogenase (HDH) [Candidatus Magnetococcus massalia]
MKVLRVGVLGFGTVGRGVVRMLLDHPDLLASRTGCQVELRRIADRDLEKDRGVTLPDTVELVDDAALVTKADDIDVVCELIGGTGIAYTLANEALESGKHVVTANKALIATKGNELIDTANRAGVELMYEAAVGGTIPIIKPIRESLAGNAISEIYGILNGTCNYILTEMREKGLSFETVLADAQERGYAEADPTFDVDGIDAAHKLTILASIAFGMPLAFDKVACEGVRHISDVDIAWATEMGYRIKLLGIAKQKDGKVEMRVQPTLVEATSMLGAVEGVFNAVFVNSDYADATMYYGRGAGEEPTASAVISDVTDIARNVVSGAKMPRIFPLNTRHEDLKMPPMRPQEEMQGAYYLRLSVLDQPGVLADITAVLKDHDVSIDAIVQKARSPMEHVPLVMVTHEATEKQVMDSLEAIKQLSTVNEQPRFIRIETL